MAALLVRRLVERIDPVAVQLLPLIRSANISVHLASLVVQRKLAFSVSDSHSTFGVMATDVVDFLSRELEIIKRKLSSAGGSNKPATKYLHADSMDDKGAASSMCMHMRARNSLSGVAK